MLADNTRHGKRNGVKNVPIWNVHLRIIETAWALTADKEWEVLLLYFDWKRPFRMRDWEYFPRGNGLTWGYIVAAVVRVHLE